MQRKTIFERFSFEIPENLTELITKRDFERLIGYNDFIVGNKFEILGGFGLRKKVFDHIISSIEEKIPISNIIDFELDYLNGWGLGAPITSLSYNSRLKSNKISDFVFNVMHYSFEDNLKLLDNETLSTHNLEKTEDDRWIPDFDFYELKIEKYKCKKCGISIFSDFLKHKHSPETKFYCKKGLNCDQALISEIIE